MVDETTDIMELIRERILDAIDRSAKGRKSIKIKTLMGEFGFNAVQRVRQSSFLAILDMLDQWGIEYRYEGTTANDYITLLRVTSPPSSAKPLFLTPSARSVDSFVVNSPLAFLFRIGETLDEARSQSLAIDVQNAVWSFQPVCLLVEAGEEFFSFVCGFFSAMMRRRALMIRHGVMIVPVPLAPDIVTGDHLKRFLGQTIDFNSQSEFPRLGSVYILRDSLENLEDDELIALVRECFIPHTYRFKAKYATTSGDPSQGTLAIEAPDFSRITEWMTGFAGTFQLSQKPLEQRMDLASLLAEASQTRDALLERQALRPTDSAFRAGFESTEHMVLKSALLNGLRRRNPEETIAVEEFHNPLKDDAFADQDTVDVSRRDKPDIRIESKLWVEVETMRALSLRGSNPFFRVGIETAAKIG